MYKVIKSLFACEDCSNRWVKTTAGSIGRVTNSTVSFCSVCNSLTAPYKTKVEVVSSIEIKDGKVLAELAKWG